MKIQRSEETGYYVVPCLGGYDVNRRAEEIVIEIVDGRITSAVSGYELQAEIGHELLGWGDLDGPSVRVAPEHVGWSVYISVADWHELLAVAAEQVAR